jgi:hypothetical protein
MCSVFKKVRKSATTRTGLKKRVFVEIFEATGGIPDGVYELEEITEHGFVMHIQKKVFLGILDRSDCKYRFISSSEDPECTTLEDFLVKYWQLMETSQNSRSWYRKFKEPITFCIMDKTIQGYLP